MKQSLLLFIFLSFFSQVAFAQTDITKVACALGRHYAETEVWQAVENLQVYELRPNDYGKKDFPDKIVTTKKDFIAFVNNCNKEGMGLYCVTEGKNSIQISPWGIVISARCFIDNQTQLPDFIAVDKSYKTTLKTHPEYSEKTPKKCNIKTGDDCFIGTITNDVVEFTAYYETLAKGDLLLSYLSFKKPTNTPALCKNTFVSNEPLPCFLGRNIKEPETIELLAKHGVVVREHYNETKKKLELELINNSKSFSLTEYKGVITRMIVYDLNLVPDEIKKFASKKELFASAGYLLSGSSDNQFNIDAAGTTIVATIFKEETTLNLSFYDNIFTFTEPLTWNQLLEKTHKGKCLSGDCINGKGKYECSDRKFIIATFKNAVPIGEGVVYSGEYDYRIAKWDENGTCTYPSATTKFCAEGDCENGYGTSLTGKTYYCGNFKNGLYHGQGYIIDYANFRRISGTFENGKEHGWITTAERNGKQIDYRRYINGVWQKTEQEIEAEEHRKTALEEKEKKRFENATNPNENIPDNVNWKCISGNCANGYGKSYESTNKVTYEGNFSDGHFQGLGKLTFPDGSTYYGEFVKNNINGHGRAEYNNGNSYVGYWKNWVFHGEGTYFVNGKWNYKGNFTNGEPTCNTCYNVEVPIPVDNGGTPLYTNRNQWLLESISRQQTERDNLNKYQDSESWFEQYQKRNY